MIKIFIVILNWNGYEDTIECLKSLGKLAISNFQLAVVVVDNGSGQEEVKKLQKQISRQARNDNIVLIKNEENLGYAGGNNVGIKHAMENGADWVLVLNNDTIVDKNILVQLIKAAQRHKKAGILSPKIYFAKGYEFKKRYKKNELGKVIWYAGGEVDWRNVYGSNRGVDEVDEGQYDREQKLEFATGACMMLRAKALKKVGKFNDRYFLYLEDADLSQRMMRMGWEVWYVPKAVLWHKVAQSSRIGSELNDYYITRNRLLFAMKYAPMRAKLAVIKESVRLALRGRKWQKVGVRDFYLRRLGKGSYGKD